MSLLNKSDTINNTYEVKLFIGQGAFGEVYSVNHKFFGIQVLKVFKEKYIQNSDIDTVINEARILSSLSHENIVRVFEVNDFIICTSEFEREHRLKIISFYVYLIF